MCSRYYMDQTMAQELEILFGRLAGRSRQGAGFRPERIRSGDVRPTDTAPVLAEGDGSPYCIWQRWGFPGFPGSSGSKVIFNARCESATEKPLFRDSMYGGRIVVPASRFYEWNPGKEKHTFFRTGSPVLFMAGLCRQYEDGAHFVILTTEANASMKPVHDRMPLILDPDDVVPWLLDQGTARTLLQKTPCLLERRTDYEQLSLFTNHYR